MVSVDLREPAVWNAPDQLRERWRRASLAGSWAFADDWWCPAVDAMVESIREGRDPRGAGDQLGRHRARSAVSLGETLDDLTALLTVVGSDDLLTSLSREVALGWAEEMSSAQVAVACVDPLTGFATAAYLRSRLGEVYAAAAHRGVDAGQRSALVVVDAAGEGGTSPFGALASMISLREVLATIFPGGETIARTGTARAVVLARRDEVLTPRHQMLRTALRAGGGSQHRTWIEALPSTLHSARELVADLGR